MPVARGQVEVWDLSQRRTGLLQAWARLMFELCWAHHFNLDNSTRARVMVEKIQLGKVPAPISKSRFQRSPVVERSAVNHISERFRGFALFPRDRLENAFLEGKEPQKCVISTVSHVISKQGEQYHTAVTMTLSAPARAFTRAHARSVSFVCSA